MRTVSLFGRQFAPMTPHDRAGFSDAPLGSLIHYVEHSSIVLLYDPGRQELHVECLGDAPDHVVLDLDWWAMEGQVRATPPVSEPEPLRGLRWASSSVLLLGLAVLVGVMMILGRH